MLVPSLVVIVAMNALLVWLNYRQMMKMLRWLARPTASRTTRCPPELRCRRSVRRIRSVIKGPTDKVGVLRAGRKPIYGAASIPFWGGSSFIVDVGIRTRLGLMLVGAVAVLPSLGLPKCPAVPAWIAYGLYFGSPQIWGFRRSTPNAFLRGLT